jgi:hypothetical protein
VTVYYTGDRGAHVAYTIVGGGALPWPDDTRAVTRGWMRVHVYSEGGRRVITWRNRGHQCLIVGARSLPEAALLTLAAAEA